MKKLTKDQTTYQSNWKKWGRNSILKFKMSDTDYSKCKTIFIGRVKKKQKKNYISSG